MKSLLASERCVPWTWADLLSTYRYWGLFTAYSLAFAATQTLYTFVFARYRELVELRVESFGLVLAWTHVVWILLALLLAWIAIRTRPVRVLLIAATLATAVSFAALIPGISPKLAFFLTYTLIPLLSGMLMILFVALLAGSGGGYQTFLVTFGVAWAFGQLLYYGISALTGALVSAYGYASSSWVISVLLLLALICLAFVRQDMFTIDPPQRGRSFLPVNRDPVAAALLAWFVPFYLVYWLYRIHGEEAHIRPSRQLLSPRAAAWIAVVPVVDALLFPIMLSTLADQHNEVAEAAGIPRVQRPWAVFLWSVLFAPVAIGLIQSNLNALAGRAAQPETVAAS